MARQVTKAVTNRYCQARLEAAKYNDKFSSRASAAEELGCITEDSLKKYELDITNPPNDVVAIMADAYNSPELIMWYCANECPLGKHSREMPKMPPERAVLRMTNVADDITISLQELSKILDDGRVDDEEREKIPKLFEDFLEVRRRVDEILTVLEKVQSKQ